MKIISILFVLLLCATVYAGSAQPGDACLTLEDCDRNVTIVEGCFNGVCCLDFCGECGECARSGNGTCLYLAYVIMIEELS